MNPRLPVLVLLLAACLVRFLGGHDPEAAVRLPDGAVALRFSAAGMQGPIRGEVLLQGDRILRVRVLASRDGWLAPFEGEAGYLAGFAGRPAAPPVPVDAVTGATVSCSAFQAGLDERIRGWLRERH